MSTNDRSITLKPSWKSYFWYYFFGILFLPLGLGLFVLIYAWRRQTKTFYILRDRSITYKDTETEVTLDLADIRNTDLRERRFDCNDIILKTNTREVVLRGIENGESIKSSIDLAIEAELKRLAAEKKTKPRESKFKPGSMDGLEYLTGLWQQGLITNEEYDTQRRKYEENN
ncbi:hypothetical protein AB2B38_003390 [Balneola sp. MJW-20]|uniref:hypothetical protein n=1 Tax=Gracilimonas aurantiaca TaxID=3234185 RepID=UPI003467C0AF